MPHSSSCDDVLEISLIFFVLSTIIRHTLQVSLVEIFASSDHGFGVSNNGMIFDNDFFAAKLSKIDGFSFFFPLRRSSLLICPINNASV